MDVNPYLMLNGRCEEALAFYQSALGATDVHVVRFRDGPPSASMPGAKPDQVMHASFRIGESTILASDGPGQGSSPTASACRGW